MTLVVGIDPSARKIALVSAHTVLRTVHTQSSKLYPKGVTRQTPESLGNAVVAMREFLQWAELIAPEGTRRVAWIETPLVSPKRSVAATLKQTLVGGIIRGLLVEAGFEVNDVHVGTWKKSICGSGNAEKKTVETSIKQRWPKVHSLVKHDGDLIDAAAICLHGVLQIERPAPVDPVKAVTEPAGSRMR